MPRIYCLITTGGSLTEDIAEHLFETAQELMSHKGRKGRLHMPEIKLRGEITTGYTLSFVGSLTGFVFKATMDWDGGSVKTDFIVKPLKNPKDADRARWVRAPLFPVAETNPALN